MEERKKIKPVRSEDTEVYVDKLTPMGSIAWFCIDCSGGSVDEARKCEMDDCPLHTNRLNALKHRNKALVIPPTLSEKQLHAIEKLVQAGHKHRESLDSDKD